MGVLPFCVCVLSALIYPRFVSTWDLAVTVEGQIEFFNRNGTRAGIASQQFSDLTALTYDPVYQTLYFADTQHQNATIFSFHLTENKDIEHLVSRSNSDNVQGIAFDPVSGLLFWTDGNNKSIYWASLVPGSNAEGKGRVLIQMDVEVPQGIAVDSCRGMIYWTNLNLLKPSIERATLEGTNREVIIKDELFMPVGIAVDQGSKRIYWADDKEGIYYRLESASLDGSDRKVIYHGTNHQPYNLAVTKESIYWTDWVYKSVWQLPLDRTNSTQPIAFMSFSDKSPMGIVSRVNILEQIEGVAECKILEETILNRTASQDEDQDFGIVSNIQTPLALAKYCLHGGSLRLSKEDAFSGNRICNCPRGFSGSRCETTLCHNYCLFGSCLLNSEGFPSCRCSAGYKGARCHENVCDSFCLNDGICKVNDESQPTCKCPEGWTGERCEVRNVIVTTTVCSCLDQDESKISTDETLTLNLTGDTSPTDSPSSVDTEDKTGDAAFLDSERQRSQDLDSERRNSSHPHDLLNSRDDLFEEPSSQQCLNWDMREPVIAGLSVLCLSLAMMIALLVMKIVLLSRRPRIRKRIIVNKNVTPLTCRPNPPQCEITIENCCNMNICETPCFEPEGLREQLRDGGKKEEKKNLLLNIEKQDDTY